MDTWDKFNDFCEFELWKDGMTLTTFFLGITGSPRLHEAQLVARNDHLENRELSFNIW